MPHTRKLQEKETLVVDAYNNGMTIKKLAEFYECSTGTIRNTLIRQGVTRRPRGRSKVNNANNGN